MKPLVIGVIHTTNQENYADLVNIISEQVRPGYRVAIESPMDKDEITKKAKECPCGQHQFLGNLVEIINKKSGIPIPVEDIRAFNIMSRRRIWFMFDGGFGEDWIANYLSMYRSVRHLELAVENKSDILITGVCHAYDLEKFGYPNVLYVPKLKNNSKISNDEWYSREWADKLKQRARKIIKN